MVDLALYQPDIPQNTGTLIRLCAAFDLPMHIIEPCGFVWNHKGLGRAAMDYANDVDLTRHHSWEHFTDWKPTNRRLVLMTTKTETSYTDFTFRSDDILMAGRESAGVPDHVHDFCSDRVTIPQKKGRSLNVAIASAIVVSEALRQLK